jgi:predicted enzyme related to lactoylglutathione lyase
MRIKLAGLIASLAIAIAACTTVTGPDLSGMSFSDEPLTGKFVWYDLITEDLDASMRFYEELFGWTFEDGPARSGGRYVVARDGGVYVAGLLQATPRTDGQNVSRWLPYVSVGDVDDAVARSVAAGATVAVAARDVALGRVAAIIDSEGAVVGLAESDIGDPDDRTTRAAPGRTVWTELLANDPARAAAFYRAITGYSVREIERRGGQYTILSSAGADRAGILEKPSPQIASTWLTHFGVADPDAAADRARQLGGTVLVPASPDLRDDTMAIVTDPAGAVLVLHRVGS